MIFELLMPATTLIADIKVPIPVGLITIVVLVAITGGIYLLIYGIAHVNHYFKVRSARASIKSIKSKMSNGVVELAATMIAADGEIQDAEIKSAIEIGEQMLPEFNQKKLISYCKNTTKIRNVEVIAIELSSSLDKSALEMIVRYLVTIAFSDGDFSSEEQALIVCLCKTWKIDLESLLQPDD